MSPGLAAVATRSLRGPAARIRVLSLGGIEVLPPPVAPLAARTRMTAALQNPRLFSSAAATAARDSSSKGAAPQRDALLMVPPAARPWAMMLGNRRLLSTDRVAEDAGDATKVALAAKEAGNATKVASAAKKTEEAVKKNTSKDRSESSSGSKDDKNFSFRNMLQKFIKWLLNMKEEYISSMAVGMALLSVGEYFLQELDEEKMAEINERLTKSLSIEGIVLTKTAESTDPTNSTESTDDQLAQKRAEIDAQKMADQKKEMEEFRHTAIIEHLQCLKDTLSNNHYLEQEIHELMFIIHKYYQNITEGGVECNIEMEERLQARAANISSLDDQLTALQNSRLS